MGSLKIALTQKIMQPRTKIWLLVFELLSCGEVFTLLQYHTALQGTKELWLRLFVCVQYTYGNWNAMAMVAYRFHLTLLVQKLVSGQYLIPTI